MRSPIPYSEVYNHARKRIKKVAEVQNTPEVKEVKETPVVGKDYTYASMILNKNFDDFTNHLCKLFEVNNFSKTSGIPALTYFHEGMKGEKLSRFVADCKNSPDRITHIPAPQKTLGESKFSVKLSDVPTIVECAEKLYDVLITFRMITGYKEEKVSSKEKVMTLDSLAEVKAPARES